MKSSMLRNWRLNNSTLRMANSQWPLLIFIVFCFLPCGLFAQTLFTYGKHGVSRDEFLRAYNKNNSDSTAGKISYNDYLELYLRFKLKVQAALDARLDTSAAQNNELRSFRQQLSESFMKEDASVDILVEEAFERSLKDIHLSHIFVAVPKTAPQEEVQEAQNKINAAYSRLENGESFDKAAASYNHADLGYITAFVLPYSIETIAYSTAAGQYSKPFQSSSGFHILRNDGERKAMGKMRVAQILLAYPIDSTAEKNKKVELRADSVYKALQAGANFAALAEKLSDDHLSYLTGGEIPVFGVGVYDTVFENAAYSLQHDSDISKPIRTSFGWHILKRLQHMPVVEDRTNKEWMTALREKVTASDRMQTVQKILVESIRKKIAKNAPPADLATDSAILRYYRDHLENYDADFADQMKEFKEGNLLFTIMQQKVWDAAATDSVALKEYFNKYRNKYQWENSADALIFTCLDEHSTEQAQLQVKTSPDQWRQWSEASNGMIQADSGRFELSQIPVVERTNFTQGLATAPVVNPQDSSRTFAYIIRLYPEKEGKKYEDAKGSVINDYQTYLEETWIAELKKKYPVKINKKVFNALAKH